MKLKKNLEVLPQELFRMVQNSKVKRSTVGCSTSSVYKLEGVNGENAYLEIQDLSKITELRWEKDALQWLKGKFSVPEVLYYVERSETGYLLISEVKGLDSHEPILLASPERTHSFAGRRA